MAVLSMISMAYFMRQPDSGAAIVASCACLGVFALGCYPLALELVVECTYPVDQAAGTAFLFLSSAIQGVILMLAENGLGRPLTEDEMLVQSCVAAGESGHQQPKDYGSYLTFITVYMSSLIIVFALFFRTEMKRTLADAAIGGRADAEEMQAALEAVPTALAVDEVVEDVLLHRDHEQQRPRLPSSSTEETTTTTSSSRSGSTTSGSSPPGRSRGSSP